MHKDLYVEVDALEGRAPSPEALSDVVGKFALHGITLHATLDETDGPAVNWTLWGSFDSYKDTGGPQGTGHFGTSTERAGNWMDVRQAKALAYRYCVFADTYDNDTRSGKCKVPLPNRDFVVTLGGWGATTRDEQAGTFMHKLGHALGLRHGGFEDRHGKPNYFSVMNYLWQTPVRLNNGCGGASLQQLIAYQNSWVLEYSSGNLLTLDESNLSEPAGLGGDAGSVVPVGPPPIATQFSQLVPMGGPVNWDRVGSATAVGVAADANYVMDCLGIENASPGDVLVDHDDWAALQLAVPSATLLATYESHSVTELDNELTLETLEDLGALQFDCNLNRLPDADDISAGRSQDTNGNGVPDECEAGVVGVGDQPQATTLALSLRRNPARIDAGVLIEFSVPRRAAATVRIHDVAGALTRTLFDGEADAGAHVLVWNGATEYGTRVSPGVFFVSLAVEGRKIAQRLVVLH